MARSLFRKNCLVPLVGKVKKYRFVGFDVETVNDEFYSGGLWWKDENDVEQWFYTTDKQELINKLLSREFTKYKIVATNLGYDFNSLFFDTPEWDEFNSIILKNSRIMFADWRPKSKRKVHGGRRDASHGRVCFYDTLNYAMMSVEALGEILGVPKLEAPSFLGKRKPIPYGEKNEFKYFQDSGDNVVRFYSEFKELEEYNKRDCKISCLFAYFFQDGLNELGGKMQMTAASSSMDLYRRAYMKKAIVKEKFVLNDEGVNDFIFDGYYGGRTEAFSRGRVENANYYDINSLYPFVMQKSLPVPQSVKEVKSKKVSIIKKYFGVTKCRVEVPKMKYPPLPVKREKLLFPCGEFTGTWNNNELAYAMSLGVKIKKIYRQIIYQESDKPFYGYVNDLYQKRLKYKSEGNAFQIVVKLMMNSLYGKFAQKGMQEYRVFDIKNMPMQWAIEERKRKTQYKIEYMDNKILFRKDKVCKNVFIFPIYSSYITSYARIEIHKYIHKHNALYADTDSVITMDTIPTGKELGQMKEEAFNQTAILVKPKFYLFGDDVKIKGLSRTVDRNGKIIKTGKEEFYKILGGESVDKKRFSGLKESLRRGFKPNKTILVSKLMGLEDNKRQWKKEFDFTQLQESEAIVLNEV